MTKGKMLCMILVQLIVAVGSSLSCLRAKKQSFKSSYSCLLNRGNTEVIFQIGSNHGERGEACEVFHPLKSTVCRRAATCTKRLQTVRQFVGCLTACCHQVGLSPT